MRLASDMPRIILACTQGAESCHHSPCGFNDMVIGLRQLDGLEIR